MVCLPSSLVCAAPSVGRDPFCVFVAVVVLLVVGVSICSAPAVVYVSCALVFCFLWRSPRWFPSFCVFNTVLTVL